MADADYWSSSATSLAGTVVNVPSGSALETVIKGAAGSGVTLMLKGGTYGTTGEYSLNWTNLAPGTFVGGVRVKGPLPPTRDTYAGSRGAATQLSQSQLAGKCASIKVTGGPTTGQQYNPGVAGWGTDGLVFEDVFMHGETMPAAQALIVGDVSNNSTRVAFRRAKICDFTGGLVSYCYYVLDDGDILCESGTSVLAQLPVSGGTYTTPNDGITRLYTVQGAGVSNVTVNGVSQGASISNFSVGPNLAIVITYTTAPVQFFWTYVVLQGIFAPTYYQALNCPIHDYFNNNHFYIGVNGPAARNTGQYMDWIVAGGIRFNPSGLYSMDVGFDPEMGSTLGLRKLEFDWIDATDCKPFYTTQVGEITGDTISLRVTRAYGSAPGNTPSAGCPAFSSAGSSGVTTGALRVRVKKIVIIQEANSNPVAQPPHAIGLANYTYLGDWEIGSLDITLNGPAFQATQSGVVPAIVRLIQPGTGAANQFFDRFAIGELIVRMGIAVNGSGLFVPSGKAIAVVGVGEGAGGGAITMGRLEIGRIIFPTGGPTAVAQTFPALSGGASTFTVLSEGTYQISGGTLTGIQINGITQGALIAGSWHLQPGETITVLGSVLPTTFNAYFGPGEPLTGGDGVNALYSTVLQLGAAATTETLAAEMLGVVDYSALAAAAITTPIRSVPAGTWTSTKRSVQALSPVDPADTVADAVGSGTFTYTHGTTNLVTKGRPADGPGTLVVRGGTFSNMTVNGTSVATAAVAGGIPVDVEIGDVVVLTQTANPASIGYSGDRRAG